MQRSHALWTKVTQQLTKPRFHTRVNKLLVEGEEGDAHLKVIDSASGAETRLTLFRLLERTVSNCKKRVHREIKAVDLLAGEDLQAFLNYQMNTNPSFIASVGEFDSISQNMNTCQLSPDSVLEIYLQRERHKCEMSRRPSRTIVSAPATLRNKPQCGGTHL